jgi:carbonic anhydrase
VIPTFPISSGGTSFSYALGGNEWANSTNKCAGSKQSPINLDESNVSAVPSGHTFQLNLLNNAAKCTCKSDQSMNCQGYFSDLVVNHLDGTLLLYHGVGFQIHAPSEHFLNGRLYDVEIQLIHSIDPANATLTTQSFAVVSILFAAVDSAVSGFFNIFRPETFTKMTTFNLFAALQGDYSLQSGYLLYEGSMTVPPCNETVTWFVMTNPVPLGLDQLGDINILYRINKAFARGRGNNRYIQRSQDRPVYQTSFVNNMAIDMSTSPFFTSILSSAIGVTTAVSS